MKKYLFILSVSLVAGMAAYAHPDLQATSLWAGNPQPEEGETIWSPPVEPTLNQVGSDIRSGECYYIKNIGAGQFLTGANSWSTQISLTAAGYKDTNNPPLIIQVVDTTIIMSGSSISGYAMKVYGSQKVYGDGGERIISNTLLFRESDEYGYIDYNNQGRGCVWNITKRNGYYRIRTADGDKYFGDLAYQYAGWYDWNGPIEVDEYGNLTSGVTHVNFDCWNNEAEGDYDESANIDWMFIPVAQYQQDLKVYQARLALYDLLMEAEEYNVNTKYVGAVYTNEQATIEDLQDATIELQENINRVRFLNLLSEATEDSPVEATEFVLVNPDFEEGNINGWTTNYVSGQQANNIGYQGASYNNDDVYVSRFIEAWKSESSPYVIGDGYLQQVVYGLPAGKYVLEADVISVYQWSNEAGSNPAQGVYLFIQSGNNEVRTNLATGNGVPEHFSISYVSQEGDVLTFGLKTENATANWIAADNFRIFYYGPTQDSQTNLELKVLVAKANEMTGMTLDVKAEFDAAVNTAQSAISNDDETVKAAALEGLKAAMEKASRSIEKVNAFLDKYRPYYNAYNSLAATGLYTDETFPSLINRIETLNTSGTFQSEEHLSNLYAMVKEEWGTYIGSKTTFADATPENPDDLTGAIINPKFSDLTGIQGQAKGWDVVWDGTGNVNEAAYTAETNTLSGYELWNTGAFRFTQTLKGLPKGCYRLMMDGFYRCGTPENAQNHLYAGTSVVNVYLFAADATMAIHDWGLKATPNANVASGYGSIWTIYQADGTETYAPNRVAVAGQFLREGCYVDNALDFYFDGAEEGFSFGVRKDNVIAEDWAYIDNFRLLYLGNGIEAYAEAIQSHINEMEEVMERSILTVEGVARCEAAAAAAETALAGEDVAACIAVIEQINAAALYIQEGDVLGKTVKDVCEKYVDRVDNVPTSNNWMTDYLATSIDSLYEGTYPNNEWLSKKAFVVECEWGAFVMQDANNPSDLNPYDASAFFCTTNFVGPNGNGNIMDWKLTISGNSWNWTTTGMGGFQTWNPQVFSLSHPTFYGLPEGFYRLTVNGYYRKGASPDQTAEMQRNGTEESCAYLYMNDGLNTERVLLAKYTEGAQKSAIASGAEAEVVLADSEGNLGSYYLPDAIGAATYYYAKGCYQKSLEMEIKTGELSVGVALSEFHEGNMIGLSNFKLEYLGGAAARQNLLATTLASLQDYLDEGKVYENTLREEAQTLITAGNALLDAQSTDGAALSAAIKGINNHISKIETSMAAYADLLATIESVEQRQSWVKDLSDEAKAEVQTALSEATTNYSAGSYTLEGIKDEIAALNQLANRLLTNYLVITVKKGGVLADSIYTYVSDFADVENLKVIGPLDEDDISTFQSLTNLVEVDLAEAQITNLNSAFENHTLLKKAVLPNNLTYIGQELFSECSALEEVTLPGSLGDINNYSYYVFSGLTNLKKVTLGEGITSVGYGMFYDCYRLSEVSLPSTLKNIGGYAFYNCYSYGDIQLPQNLTTISYDAFYRDDDNATVYRYKSYYYDEYGRYQENYDTITAVSPKHLEIPASVTRIEGAAFYNLKGLQTVTLNEGLTSIEDYAFYNTSVRTAAFPSTLTSVGSNIFNAGTYYTCMSLVPPSANNGCPVENPETLYVPKPVVKTYKQANGWNKFKIEGIDAMPNDIIVSRQMKLDFANATMPEGYKPNITIQRTNVGVSSSSTPTTLGALEFFSDENFAVGTFTLQGYNHAQRNYYFYNWGSSNSRKAQSATLLGDGTISADNIDITMSLTDGYWNFISVPYPVRVGDITPETEGTQWTIRYYDGAARAAGNLNNTWVNLSSSDILEPGKGYIMHCTYSQSMYNNVVFHFPALNTENKNLIFSAANRTIQLDENQSEAANNRGWNLIGNPYPAYLEIGSLNIEAPITVWNGRNGYYAYSPLDDNYVLCPGEAFFVQRPENQGSITFPASARQSYYDVTGTTNYVKGEIRPVAASSTSSSPTVSIATAPVWSSTRRQAWITRLTAMPPSLLPWMPRLLSSTALQEACSMPSTSVRSPTAPFALLLTSARRVPTPSRSRPAPLRASSSSMRLQARLRN